MLIRVSTTNFLSIDTTFEFSALALKESRHQQRVATPSSARVLQTSVVWGANGSGKSNFCSVLLYAQWLVAQGTRTDGPTMRRPFKLKEQNLKTPSYFEFDILVDDKGIEKLFRYKFAVNGSEILEESLSHIKLKSEQIYFTRKFVKGRNEPKFTLDFWERKSIPEEDRQFARFVAKGTQHNQLFLHEASGRNIVELGPVFRWFRDQLEVIQPDDDFLALVVGEPERGELREYTAQLLADADTGISGIEALEVPIGAMAIPPEHREKIYDLIKEEGRGVIYRQQGGTRFSVFLKDGELIASRLVTYHENEIGEKVPFELSEESDGTRRVFDFAPLLHELDSKSSKKVFIIDEFDRSLHYDLALEILDYYLKSRTPATRNQLIITSHNLMLMDQQLFRRDEMWIMIRRNDGSSVLERISSHKDLRHDKDIRKAYLDGKFSGRPELRLVERIKSAADPNQLELFDLDEQE